MRNKYIRIAIRAVLLSLSALAMLPLISCSKNTKEMKNPSVYSVSRLDQPMPIDGNWDKSQWQDVQAAEISNYMGEIPKFKPVAKAKMRYDDENLYVIFRVEDQFVRCLTKDTNGPVWEDGCVEFFFAPDTSYPLRYFNLEINCGGTPLMHYNLVARTESRDLAVDDIKMIEIKPSLPQIIDPEMAEPVTWTLEYSIPLAMLEKYSPVIRPKKGVSWRANFYKIAENSSNPHYITWSLVDIPKPDFHRPEFFGTLTFE
jgi:hypothetical protein